MVSRNRILVVVTLLSLGVAVYLAFDLYRSGQDEVLRQFKVFESLLARQSSHELASYIQDCSRDLVSLARLPSIQRRDRAQIRADLQAHCGTVEPVPPASIHVVDREGTLVVSLPEADPAPSYAGSAVLAWAARRGNQGQVFAAPGAHGAGARTNSPAGDGLLLATPLYRPNSGAGPSSPSRIWSGFLLMTLDVRPILTNYLSTMSPRPWSQRVWIMDRTGTILLQSEHPEMTGENVHRPQPQCAQCHSSFEYARQMLSASNRMGTAQYQLKGQPVKMAAFAPMRLPSLNLSWIVVVNAPYAQVTAQGQRSYTKMLLLLAVIAVTVCLASIIVHRVNLSRFQAEAQARQWQDKHHLEERIRQAEARRTAQLEALHQVGLSITAQVDRAVLLETIMDQALTLFRGTTGGLFLHQPAQDVLELVHQAGHSTAAVGVCCKKGEGLAGKVWEGGGPLVVGDYRSWEARASGSGDEACASTMGAPIRWGDSFVGVMEICSGTPNFFSHDDAVLLGLFATQAAIAIKNAGLLEQVRQDAQTQTTLLHDVNHRVKNNLTRLVEIIRLEREQALPAETGLRAALGDLESRLQGMAVVHSLLSGAQWKPLLLSDLVHQIITAALSGSPIRNQIQVSVIPPLEPVWLVPEQATAIALIINEMTTNSVKHAFRDRQQGRLQVRLQVADKVNGRSLIRIEYRDDGPGWPEAVLRGEFKRVGLHLIQASVRSPLRGEMTLRNDAGAAADLTFKLAAMA